MFDCLFVSNINLTMSVARKYKKCYVSCRTNNSPNPTAKYKKDLFIFLDGGFGSDLLSSQATVHG